MAELIVQCDEEEFDAALFSRCGGAACEADAPLSVEVVFTDAEGIRKLNADTRSKDAVTDVLSYPNLDGIFGKKIAKAEHPFDLDDEGNIFLGSIVICRERAAEQAEEYGHSLRREGYYLAVHGLCHLLGYDHETEEERAQMREKEEEILSAMNIGRDAQ